MLNSHWWYNKVVSLHCFPHLMFQHHPDSDQIKQYSMSICTVTPMWLTHHCRIVYHSTADAQGTDIRGAIRDLI